MSGELNLLKLSVGSESFDDVLGWMKHRREHGGMFHVTRMVPKRAEELLDGGSLFWVVKGQVQARQPLADIDVFKSGDGIRRCRLVFSDLPVATRWQPRRPFQGWRYLEAKDAPPDLAAGELALDPELREELNTLGLL
ncbi:MAG: DUF1489 domain-containing protein [Pseudomonadota bacterium]